MREIDLDKFLGKKVELIDCNNIVNTGILYRVKNYRVIGNVPEHIKLAQIKNGYFLRYYGVVSQFVICGCCYKKSHIKEIKETTEE